MSLSFADYTAISAHALDFNPKGQEAVARKKEIFDTIEIYHKYTPTSILFYGFNPLILVVTNKKLFVTKINDEIKNYLNSKGVKYTYINDTEFSELKEKFDWVIAADEYFTFAETEDQQRASIEQAVSLAKKTVITTLRDYKNQDFKDREFGQPLAVHNNNQSKIFLEHHNYDYTDKNSWKTQVYELQGNVANTYGTFVRRNMYFKQMAKFSIDAGAKDFYVHKNLMYKSLIKKNYEHVISISL
jgi:hypothetical protein